MRSERLKIGEVAKRAGVRVDTVRFYEKRGLLPGATRARSGYRYFPVRSIERIAFVKKAQALGFSLDETRDVLRGIDRGGVDYAAGQARLERARARIDEKIAQLESIRAQIDLVLDGFRQGKCDAMEETVRTIRQPAIPARHGHKS